MIIIIISSGIGDREFVRGENGWRWPITITCASGSKSFVFFLSFFFSPRTKTVYRIAKFVLHPIAWYGIVAGQ